MVASAVLGAATGTGLALLVAMTLVLYRYYSARRYSKEWGDVERFSPPRGWHVGSARKTKRAYYQPGYTVSTHKVVSVAKEVQPVSSGSLESVAPHLDVTGGLQATLCRTPSLSSHASQDSTASRQSLRVSGRTLSPDCRSISEASTLPLHRPRPLSPLLVPQDSTSSIREGPTSPLPLGSLQPHLYTRSDTVRLRSSDPAGKLHLTIHYDFDRSDLHVQLIEGEDVVGGFSEPYVRVSLDPAVDSRVRQTATRPQPNPTFNQNFKFPVSFDDLNDKMLVLQVFDYDRYSRNDIVGELRICLGEMDITSSVEIWGDIAKQKKPPEELQEVLISLSYLPSAERLTVVLLKARNLFTPENRESVDPFVKVYLLSNGKRIKKKKTAARKSSPNPVWNEAITFNISSTSLQASSVEICVVDQGSERQAVLGSVVIGAEEEGSSHWAEVLSSPRKAIAMWHTLR